ncbi:TPA: NUDIX domain-containing protein [Candidatus Woesearchaeota archaeon]|nr:NUDIX domain-containing protein [Candidatus Woesearchaeota archaeon]
MPATEITLKSAKQNKLFYVVANVVIYRKEDQRCLILKRSPYEVAHPGKYAVPGGKLEWADLPLDKPTRINDDVLDYENAIEELLFREAQEEAGVEIDFSQGLKYINSVAFIRPDGIPVVLVKYAAPYKSGEVKLEEKSFTDYAWVNAEEAEQYDCIKGIPKEIALTIKFFQREK